MLIGQAQDLPLQGWCRRASVGTTLVVARCIENTAHGHLLVRHMVCAHLANDRHLDLSRIFQFGLDFVRDFAGELMGA